MGALEQDIPNELPYNDYFEYFGPDFKLHIAPSNMANQNTSEYVDKIRSRLLENLRMLPHAPGVQMADVPEDSIDLNKEDEKEDGEDKDKRSSMKLMDKRVEPDNEFEAGKSGNKNTQNHGEPMGQNPWRQRMEWLNPKEGGGSLVRFVYSSISITASV
eukprot:TRINITY_DN24308_c0_g1_i1.p1 TRINITY_DN24308_c0_g1~~TRINITY_DN24308_c0_g1_i1.p1  ORF type:complete len:167 (-),score=35.43 TRINITY_DN24308_c0_g1_i1:99-575(-)